MLMRPEAHEPFNDERGSIQDLLTHVSLDSVTRINTRAGAIRGNHWHEQTVQWTYVVNGKLLVKVRKHGDHLLDQWSDVVYAGDLFVSPAGEEHAWQALEDTEVLVFTHGPRSGENYESDTHRLNENERLI